MPGPPLRSALLIAVVSLALLALAVRAGGAATFTVHWTAPGDNGVVGTAALYEFRWSAQAITPSNYASAALLPGAPAPAPAGTRQSFTFTASSSGGWIYLAMRTEDRAGNWSPISNVLLLADLAAVGDQPRIDALSPAWPAPASSAAHLRLSQAARGRRDLIVFDAAGRRVRTLARGEAEAGAADMVWDLRDDRGRRVPPGVYLVRASIGAASFTRRIAVL